MSTTETTSYVLFVPSPQGYRLQERSGALPAQGDELDLGEAGVFVVTRVGPSPYPMDARRCAYLVKKP
jgi:hypothetical protein